MTNAEFTKRSAHLDPDRTYSQNPRHHPLHMDSVPVSSNLPPRALRSPLVSSAQHFLAPADVLGTGLITEREIRPGTVLHCAHRPGELGSPPPVWTLCTRLALPDPTSTDPRVCALLCHPTQMPFQTPLPSLYHACDAPSLTPQAC